MKSWGTILLAIGLLMTAISLPVYAAEKVENRGYAIYLDNEPIALEGAPVLKGGYVRVDAKSLFAADRLSWQQSGNSIQANRTGLKLALTIDSKQATLNGTSLTLAASVEKILDHATIALEDFARLTGKELVKSINGRQYYLKSSLKDRIYFALNDKGHDLSYVGASSGGKRSGNGTLSVNGIVLYEGQFVSDAMQGKGKLFLDDRLIYEGGFQDNAPNGIGTIYLASGEKYEGAVNDGRRQGLGRLYRGAVLLYDGDWTEDRMNGAGTIYSGNQQLVYSGQLRDEVRDGFGIFYVDGERQYQGDWKNGKKEGQGILFNDDGSLLYIGAFANDRQNGSGAAVRFLNMNWISDGPNNTVVSEMLDTAVFDKGNFVDGVQINRKEILYYTGEFNANKVPNGIGNIYRHKGNTVTRSGVMSNNELIYMGAVLDGKRHGSGTAYQDNKLIYSGQYANDLRKGLGKEYDNGLLVYDGEWAADFKNGEGKTFRYSGNVAAYTGQGTVIVTEGQFLAGKLRTTKQMYKYIGDIQKGAMTGSGLLYSISASDSASPFSQSGILSYSGNFLDGRKHGQGRLYSGGSLIFNGNFANDKKNGAGVMYSGNLKVFDGYYVDDKKEGPGTEYASYGWKLYEGNYHNDQREGYGKLYENGQMVYDGDFKDNKKHGKGKLYKNGQLIYEGDFVQDARTDGK